MVMADTKHWKPTPRTGAFRYYITTTALRHFQEVGATGTGGLTDQSTALVLDEMLAIALKAKPPQDISLSINGEGAKICEVQVRHDLTMVGVLQPHRPSAFPPTPMVGGPVGMQLALMALISQERAASNFMTGRWKVVLNRPFAEPLAKLRLLSDPETLIDPATGNQAPEEDGEENETQPVTQEETPMDASFQKSYSAENVVTDRKRANRQPRKDARSEMRAAVGAEQAKLQRHAELKEKVVAALQAGMSTREVGEKFSISKSTASAWASAARIPLLKGKAGRAPGDMPSVKARNERIAYAEGIVDKSPDIRVTGPGGLYEQVKKKFGVALSENLLSKVSRRVRAKHGLSPNPRGSGHLFPAKTSGGGLAPRIRELLADGKPRTIGEVATALDVGNSKTGIELSNLARRKTDKSIKALGDGVYQYQGKGVRKPAAAGIKAPSNSTAAINTREERVLYAAEQFRLNPDLPISGKGGVESMLHDRFGMSIDRAALSKLRDDVVAGRAPTGSRDGRKPMLKTTPTSPTIGKTVLKAMPVPTTEDGLMAALTLAITREKQLKDAYNAARATTKMLLEQMQKIRE